MIIVNTFSSQDEKQRASRFCALCRRCILLLHALRARE